MNERSILAQLQDIAGGPAIDGISEDDTNADEYARAKIAEVTGWSNDWHSDQGDQWEAAAEAGDFFALFVYEKLFDIFTAEAEAEIIAEQIAMAGCWPPALAVAVAEQLDRALLGQNETVDFDIEIAATDSIYLTLETEDSSFSVRFSDHESSAHRALPDIDAWEYPHDFKDDMTDLKASAARKIVARVMRWLSGD